MTKVAFLGLGVMGYPMAGYLQKAGFETTVYNRTTAKAEKWVAEYGGNMAKTPAEAVESCDFVFACVGADDDLRDITIGKNGAFENMKSSSVFVDHTTTSDTVAKELYEVAKGKNIEFMDAPVSGGQAGAQNGQLTIMCGGDESTFTKSEPVMQSYAKYCGLIGNVGAGQICKMINQISFTHAVQGLAEAITFAKKAGLDTDKVFNAISGGAAGSWQMSNRWQTMAKGEFDFGFAVDLGLKDLNLVMDCAKKMGLDIPTTEQITEFYTELQQNGHGGDDTSALIRRYNNK